jgi:hypothetical protein
MKPNETMFETSSGAVFNYEHLLHLVDHGYSGVPIDEAVTRQLVESIRIEDIAHSLATQTRYMGHCKFPYSIAEHSVLMAIYNPFDADPLALLLHDSAEAYIGDLIRPWKRQLYVRLPISGEFVEVAFVEAALQAIIERKSGLESHALRHPLVKKTDDLIAACEARLLLPSRGMSEPWRETGKRWGDRMDRHLDEENCDISDERDWREMERAFLGVFGDLQIEKGMVK